MRKLSLGVIGTLEQYQQQRALIRRAMIEHKRSRLLSLGPHVTLHFEDYMTMKYQVQEMMYIERLQDPAAVQEEIDVYNPLIPDGSNLKCTMMIEFPDQEQRRQALRELVELEHRIFLQIADHAPVAAIADEDLPRSTADKTSAVHFLRFEFTPPMIAAARSGATWRAFADHPRYRHQVDPMSSALTRQLLRDFEPRQTADRNAANAHQDVATEVSR